MNICSLGREFDGVTEIEFSSSRTVLDFDAVFIDTVGLVQGSGQAPKAISFRRDEFSEFLALGRTIVVFCAPVQLEVFLPIPAVGTKAIAGIRVDIKGPDSLKAFWKCVQQDMQFMAYFESTPGNPFLFVSATSKPVGSLLKHERGTILFLPWLMASPYPSDYKARCRRFVSAFEKLNEHLVPKKPIAELPVWSAHYGWERERKLRANLVSLQTQSDDILKKITSVAFELEVEDRLKVLFTGTGDVLADTVISVFQELGVKAHPGEPGRDDIVVEFDEKFAVIEVKGRKSSAAESDAAQLEKWVAGFMEEKEKAAKGILLVNAFCETPLTERKLAAFPNQMLKYSSQREHCLMTTTQLLGMLLEVRIRPSKRVDLVNSLFSTIGVYQEFLDWQTFLTAPNPPVQREAK